MDAPSILDPLKCVSSILMSLSCLLPLECTQFCVLTKCDLLSDPSMVERFLDMPSCQMLLEEALLESKLGKERNPFDRDPVDNNDQQEGNMFFDSYATLALSSSTPTAIDYETETETETEKDATKRSFLPFHRQHEFPRMIARIVCNYDDMYDNMYVHAFLLSFLIIGGRVFSFIQSSFYP